MPYQYTPDEYGRPPHLSFDTPMDFVQYARDLEAGRYPGVSADPATLRQAQEIAANPEGWEMYGGHPRRRPDWLARNLPWLGPALVGGGILGLGLAGGGAAAAGAGQGAASAAGGTLPSYGPSAGMIAAGSGLPSVGAVSPAAAMGAGASGAGLASQLAQGGGGSLLGKILTGLKDYGPLALAGAGAIKGMTQGKTPAENQLEALLQMATGRAQATEPLFQALNRMTTAQLPKYTRGES